MCLVVLRFLLVIERFGCPEHFCSLRSLEIGVGEIMIHRCFFSDVLDVFVVRSLEISVEEVMLFVDGFFSHPFEVGVPLPLSFKYVFY